MILLTRRQAAYVAPLGIDFERHPDCVVFDPDALDAGDVIIRPETPVRMQAAAMQAGAR